MPESSRVFSSIYVILWLLLGSIIFRNIIVAMMGKHRGEVQLLRRDGGKKLARRVGGLLVENPV